MKRTLVALLAFLSAYAFAYDATFNVTPPTDGVAIAHYEVFVDDCTVGGPTGPPTAQLPAGGGTIQGLVTDFGTYTVCIRPVGLNGGQLGPMSDAVIRTTPADPAPGKPEFDFNFSFVLPPTPEGNVANFSWSMPWQNVDGSRIGTLESYGLYGGSAPRDYDRFVRVEPTAMRYAWDNQPAGTNYYAIVTVTKDGTSDYSNEVAKTF